MNRDALQLFVFGEMQRKRELSECIQSVNLRDFVDDTVVVGTTLYRTRDRQRER